MTSRTRRLQVLALGLAAAVLAAGCSSGPAPDTGAARAAAALAAALSAGDVSTIPFTTAGVSAEYATLAKPLSQLTSSVRVASLDDQGNKATATLAWTTGAWKHRTRVALVRSGSVWKAVWAPAVLESSLVTGERLVVTGIKAPRGDILGAGDQPLVQPRPVVRFGIDKAQAAATGQHADLQASATRLAALLGLKAGPLVKEVAKAGSKAFVEALVLRSADATQRILSGVAGIPGARAIADKLPLAPTKDFAAALLGTVGPATAELIKKSNGRLHIGDDTGLSGLQLRYDARLAGTSGFKVSAAPIHPSLANATPRVLFSTQPTPGAVLRLTLDPRLEASAQQLLTRYGPASALVAIRPSTGAVLAAASGPGSAGYNTATFGQYAPGSTFKVISSLALLRAGLTPASIVNCPTSVVVDGKTFKNYADYPANRFGRITLRQAVANSCNTAFISSRARITGTALADAAAALGFGVDHDTGFPAYFGQVPAAQSATEGAADLIGQGKVLASPMAMAAVVASVVHGATVVPDLIRGLAPVSASPTKPLTAAEAASLRVLMRAVVQEGSGAFLLGLPGAPVIAKTGTAEYGTANGAGALPTHVWMIGGQGDLAVAVFVADGQSGSHTAGPVLEAFLRAARR